MITMVLVAIAAPIIFGGACDWRERGLRPWDRGPT